MAVQIGVRVTPRARADTVEGWAVDAAGRPQLNLKVRAAPVDGEANAAVEALLARQLGVPRSAVSVIRGGGARLKQVRIEGLDLETLRRRLEDRSINKG